MLHADVQSLRLSLSANDIDIASPNAIVVSLCLAMVSGVRLTSYFIKQRTHSVRDLYPDAQRRDLKRVSLSSSPASYIVAFSRCANHSTMQRHSQYDTTSQAKNKKA